MKTPRFKTMIDQLIDHCNANGIAHTPRQVSDCKMAYDTMVDQLGSEEMALSILAALLDEIAYTSFDPWAWLQLEMPFETLIALTQDREHALNQFINATGEVTDELLDIYNLRKNRSPKAQTAYSPLNCNSLLTPNKF